MTVSHERNVHVEPAEGQPIMAAFNGWPPSGLPGNHPRLAA